MNAYKLLGFLMGLVVLISCKKEKDDPVTDLQLQKFWVLSGYYDSNDNQINVPEFNSDTVFHYEVNLFFLWNPYTVKYEIQGQGPSDIYWGEYAATDGNKLELVTLQTTKTRSAFQELNEYDSLFFHTLKKVTRYSIADEKLRLFFEDDSHYMLFELKAEQFTDAVEYISAKIDGMNWEGEADYTSATVVFNFDTELFNLNLGGVSQDTLSNGLRYDIGFLINLPPQKGEFQFNNEGVTVNSDGGVLGNCYGRYRDQYDVDTRSTTGVIAITQLTLSFIEGYFYFNAEGIGDDSGVSYNITEGEFLIQLNGPSNWFTPYVFAE